MHGKSYNYWTLLSTELVTDKVRYSNISYLVSIAFSFVLQHYFHDNKVKNSICFNKQNILKL